VEKLVVNISPPAYSLLWQRAYKYWSISFFNDETIFHLFGEIVEELRSKDIVINWCISFVLVAVAVWHNYNRRTNWFVLVMWLGVVALFSIAGFLTYWALNHNTVVKCHSCGRKRHLKQPECVHCGGSLAVPEKRPTDLVMIS
jgi:hypothetical protein